MKTMLLLAAVFPLLLKAQTISEKADELMSAYSNQHKFSGSVLIAVKNKIVFNKAYGYANLDTKQVNTTQTEFRAASLTKMFTAVLILQLVNENRLQLNDPVSKYLPGIDSSGKVTIRHLLSHTSGLKGSTSPSASSLEEIMQSYKAGTPAFEPGSAFEYNNFNFMLLSYIAQQVTGKPLDTLLQTKVLQKAGMTQSGLDYNNRVFTAKANGYVTDPSTNEWVLTGTDGTVGAASGAGALYTTTGDLFKWSLAIGSSKLLPKKLWDIMYTPVQPGYGFGMMLNNEQERYKTGHTGSIPGFIADFAHFPKDSITIIYLSNYQDLDGRKLEKKLVSLVYNEPYELPVQKKQVTMSREALQEYTGIYELQENVQIKVELQDSSLIAIAPGGDKIELTPEAKDLFFLKGPEITVQFRRENNKITAMYIDMQGGQLFKRK